MSKPRLLTQNFVQKVLAEKQERVFNIKSIIYSKNFYIFLGILSVCIILFLMFRYFDKKEKEENQLKLQEYQEKLNEEYNNQINEMMDNANIESDDEEKTTTLPHLNNNIKKNNNNQLNLKDLNIQEHNYGQKSRRVQEMQQNYQEEFENELDYNDEMENSEIVSPDIDKLNDYLDQTNINFQNIREIEYP